MAIGTLVLHQTSESREANIPVTVDFSQRHEIATGGLLLTGTPSVAVLFNDGISSDLSISGVALDNSAKKVLFNVTIAAAGIPSGRTYTIRVSCGMSGGAPNPLVETLKARVVSV